MSEYKCNYCGRICKSEKLLYRHYWQMHRDELRYEDWLARLTNKVIPELSMVPDDIKESYFRYCWENNNKNISNAQFGSFYRLVTAVREMRLSDIDRFFSHVLPWKQKNPNRGNSIELCSVVFENKEEADLLYRKHMLVKNPYYRHGSELSPFSTKHKRYQHLSEKDKQVAVSDFVTNIIKEIPAENSQLHIEYYLKQGMNKEEARDALRKRQSTFSLEKCIEKYGEEEGKKRWQRRQEKWQNTLNSKPLEEIERINRAKMAFNGFSDISQELFWEIYNYIKDDYKKIYFATINPKSNKKDNSGKSHEYIVHAANNRHYFLDFYIPEINKAIEFDGWYWHRGKGSNKARELMRETALAKLGYNIYHVEEFDYRKNHQKTIQKCIDFIKS